MLHPVFCIQVKFVPSNHAFKEYKGLGSEAPRIIDLDTIRG